MCTVIVAATRSGLVVAGNRDERIDRAPARPPLQTERDGVAVLAPVDGEQGGAWTAVNSAGLAISLLNNYQAASQATVGEPVSRGHIVGHVAASKALDEVAARLTDGTIHLADVRPFTLVAAADGAAVRLDWDGVEVTIAPLTLPAMLVSNGGDLARATAAREAVFRDVQSTWAADGPTDEQVHALFASHEPERGHYSVCMHFEPFAATRSLTTIRIGADRAQMRYVSGSPCLSTDSTTAEIAVGAPPK